MICPKCGDPITHISKARPGLEKFLHNNLSIWFYRCSLCETRIFRWEPSKLKPRARVILIFRVATLLLLFVLTVALVLGILATTNQSDPTPAQQFNINGVGGP